MRGCAQRLPVGEGSGGEGRLVLLEHGRERRHADDLDLAFQLAVGEQEQPQIGPGRHGQPAPLDEAEVLFQPHAARYDLFRGELPIASRIARIERNIADGAGRASDCPSTISILTKPYRR